MVAAVDSISNFIFGLPSYHSFRDPLFLGRNSERLHLPIKITSLQPE